MSISVAAEPPDISPQIIPKPVSITPAAGQFVLSRQSRILVSSSEALGVGRSLAADLMPAAGHGLAVKLFDKSHGGGGQPQPGDIVLDLSDPGTLGADSFHEGYQLNVTDKIILRAPTLEGLFYGLQTLDQLFPPWIAAKVVLPEPLIVPGVSITDYPRYKYRGVMVDIARHFEPPQVVEHLIDIAVSQKLNVLHLHLSDDQGFRVEIKGFPNLTKIGGQGSVGTQGRVMDPGGYWTQAQYKEVVAYAQARFMTLIPEVDSPKHNLAIIMSEYWDTKNKLLNGHPSDINCSPTNPPVWDYTEDVGAGGMCADSSNTWVIYSTIMAQLSALSNSPIYDIGGDESSDSDYAEFLNKETALAIANDEIPMAWAANYVTDPSTTPPPGAIAESWEPGASDAQNAGQRGLRVVMAPADHAYFDQTYPAPNASSLGLGWACPGCDLDINYCWEPSTLNPSVSDKIIFGVEGAMFSETITNLSQAEYMLLPRLWALSEIGWSPKVDRSSATSPAFQDFVMRVAAQAPRLQAGGTNFFWTALVPWQITGVGGGATVNGSGSVVGTLGLVSAPGFNPSSLKAAIDWGDGSPVASGSIQGTAPDPVGAVANGLYKLNTTHVYAKSNGGHGEPHTVMVTVTAASGQTGTFLVNLK